MFLQSILFYSKLLHITPGRHTCLRQAVILSSISNVFTTIVNNMTNVTYLELKNGLLKTVLGCSEDD